MGYQTLKMGRKTLCGVSVNVEVEARVPVGACRACSSFYLNVCSQKQRCLNRHGLVFCFCFCFYDDVGLLFSVMVMFC